MYFSYFRECLALICVETDGVKRIIYKYRGIVIYKFPTNWTYKNVSAII
jgi:hypothetical protein